MSTPTCSVRAHEYSASARSAPQPWSLVMGDAATWLIVPVYNEAFVVGDVVRAALEQFDNVVCVDDGSTDASAAALASTTAHLVRHLSIPPKCGGMDYEE